MTDKEQSAVNYLKIRGHSRANGNVYFVAYNLIRSLQQQLAEKDKRIAKLEGICADYAQIDEEYRALMREECSKPDDEEDDRRHCNCVFGLKQIVREKDKRIAELEAQVPKWRDTVYDPPEQGQQVLIDWDGPVREMIVGRYCGLADQGFFDECGNWLNAGMAKKWCELPTPPKESEQQ